MSDYAEPNQAFDCCNLAFVERQPTIPGETMNLVHIEGQRSRFIMTAAAAPLRSRAISVYDLRE
jgi:hypothetical protein